MSVASRTPEGFPSHCPICGAEVRAEFAEPTGDAVCPKCGCLIWRSAQLAHALRRVLSEQLGVEQDQITNDTALANLRADSLDTVELVMELEEEFDITIPDDVAERMQSIGYILKYLDEMRRKRDE
ncbi:MAG: acyl carrier protein [Planctomycetaceae bacterium]|nr:acyl carrier protein [Planctomycetaceae bacterium]